VENAQDQRHQAGNLPQVAVDLDWQAAAAVEPLHVNQVMVQMGVPAPNGVPDGIYITLGRVLPPLVGGPDEESQRKALEQLQGSTVQVGVQGRFLVSRALLDSFIQVLQDMAAKYDATVPQSGVNRPWPGKAREQR